jgi:ABC-2 type transport system ATP-binding protein
MSPRRDRPAGSSPDGVPKPGKDIRRDHDLLKAQGIAVSELQLESGRMDEVFRTITQGETAEARV